MALRLRKLTLAMCLALSSTGCMSILNIPDDLVLLELHAPPPGQSPGWMHVVLGSTFDYQKYVVENKLDAGVKGDICEKPKEFESRTVSAGIYSNYDSHEIREDIPYSEMKKNGYYRYDVFINAIRSKGWYKGFGSKPNQIDEINFLTMPEDICLYFLDFGDMLYKTRSNVVRIPKERLAEEMAHPTPGGKHFDPLKGGIIK